MLIDQYGCLGLSGDQAAMENWCITRKRRTLLAYQASRVLEKSMIYGQILNYLLASLVRSSPALSLAKVARVGCVFLTLDRSPNPGLPIRRNIPAQRNHAVACECIGYVLTEFIGSEGRD